MCARQGAVRPPIVTFWRGRGAPLDEPYGPSTVLDSSAPGGDRDGRGDAPVSREGPRRPRALARLGVAARGRLGLRRRDRPRPARPGAALPARQRPRPGRALARRRPAPSPPPRASVPRASSTRGRSWWPPTGRGASASSWTPFAASRELRPGEGEVHVLLGAVLRRAGRKAEALRAFRLAVGLETLPATRHLVMGETLLGAEGWRDALAAWSEARQIEEASGSLILRNAGRRSALNFHPGLRMKRVPRRETPAPRSGPLARLRERFARLGAGLLALLHREWRFAAGVTGSRFSGRPGARRTPASRRESRSRRRGPPAARLAAGPGGRVKVKLVALVLTLVAFGADAAERETAAAREQARQCERKNLGERRLGLPPGSRPRHRPRAPRPGPGAPGPAPRRSRALGRARGASSRGHPERPDERGRLAAPGPDPALRSRRARRGR